MSPPDEPATPPLPLRPEPTGPTRGGHGGTLLALAGGLVIGLAIVFFGVRQERFAGLESAEIGIRINDLGPRIGRDVLVPTSGWTLQIELPEGLPAGVAETLAVHLR